MSKETKDEKKARKAKKIASKIDALKCPKCTHTVAEHRSHSIYMYMFTGENPGSGCHGKNESRDEKGFIRLTDCACDLKATEVAVNAARGIQAAPMDANDLLRDLNKS